MTANKGDVVIVPYPYSDLSGAKLRPAIVVAVPGGDDLILCQMTSRGHTDRHAIPITQDDLSSGNLTRPGSARPNRVVTLDRMVLRRRVGVLTAAKMADPTDAIVAVLRR